MVGLKLEKNPRQYSLQPGTLGYPEYGVASVCFALSDVELHCLFEPFHLGTNFMGADSKKGRGGWLDTAK